MTPHHTTYNVLLRPGLQQLLSGLLEVQESRRLSITDVLHQSWLTLNRSQPITRYPAIAKAPPPVVDTSVVRYMSTMYRFSESDVIYSVTERKLNASSSTYHLLKRHMVAERRTESERSEVEDRDSAGAAERSESGTDGRRSLRSQVSEVRSQIFPPPSHRSEPAKEGGGGGGERKGGGNPWGSRQQPSSYKECILYLKEARHGLTLNGRSLVNHHHHLPPHLVLDTLAKSSHANKLPLLNLQRHHLPLHHPHPHPVNGTLADPAPDGGVGGRPHLLLSTPIHDLRLNVLGRPALQGGKERGKGSGTGEGGGAGDPSLTNYPGGAKPPPPPPNTAQGSRVSQDQSSTSSLHRQDDLRCISPAARPSSADSSRAESSLKDPFGYDTWRALFQPEVRAAAGADSEARYRPGNGAGMSFVQPLSVPKALTAREENSAGTNQRKPQSYFLVRQLAADLSELGVVVDTVSGCG